MSAVGTAGCRRSVSESCEVFVKLTNELVSIGAVDLACISDGFASGARAAEAVHTDLKEELCTTGIDIEKIADDRFFCYLNHWSLPFRTQRFLSFIFYNRIII